MSERGSLIASRHIADDPGRPGMFLGDLMTPHRSRSALLLGLALVGTTLATDIARAAPFAARLDRIDHAPRVELVRDRGGAVAAGVIAGGALGFPAGSGLARARPPAPLAYYASPPALIYEAPPPRGVIHEECVVRRTKVYEPGYGWIVRRESDCD